MIDPEPSAPLTDAFFDRIVDGDLSPAELRVAFDRLEREPDGWKRCALAFLEAQCWRESFRTMDSQASASSPSTGQRPILRGLAMAAGVATVAFMLGWRAHPERAGSSRAAAPQVLAAVGQPPTGHPAPTVDPPPSIVDRRPDRSAPPEGTPPATVIGRLKVLPVDSARVVPVVARPMIEGPPVTDQPPPITEHQRALLEQRGYQVDRRRRLITARLADGRRVTVPVEQIQLRYTGVEPL
jgi:hypothetical protein